jgi:hypothetical protein
MRGSPSRLLERREHERLQHARLGPAPAERARRRARGGDDGRREAGGRRGVELGHTLGEGRLHVADGALELDHRQLVGGPLEREDPAREAEREAPRGEQPSPQIERHAAAVRVLDRRQGGARRPERHDGASALGRGAQGRRAHGEQPEAVVSRERSRGQLDLAGVPLAIGPRQRAHELGVEREGPWHARAERGELQHRAGGGAEGRGLE